MKYLDNYLTGWCWNSWDLWRSRCHFCVQLQEVPEAVLQPTDNPRHLRRDLPRHVHHALRSPDPVSLCNGKRYKLILFLCPDLIFILMRSVFRI